MSERPNVSRRAALGSLTTAISVAIAGCGGDSGGGSPTGTSAGTPMASGTYMNGVGDDASVDFDVPSGDTDLTSTYAQWQASAEGVTIEESGEVTEGAGHLHIMVDTDSVEPGETIPSDDSHVHYGTGQTDGVLELEPGDHTLNLQVGDGYLDGVRQPHRRMLPVADEASLDLETTVNGSVVDWTVTAQNYTIEPSSEGINSNAGHLHAIIDADHVPVGDVIPSDANHVHFGDGSTSGTLDLADQLGDDYEPGEHKIHFQVGSGTHRATMVHAHTTVTTE